MYFGDSWCGGGGAGSGAPQLKSAPYLTPITPQIPLQITKPYIFSGFFSNLTPKLNKDLYIRIAKECKNCQRKVPPPF